MISIVIPLYNKRNCLPRTLQSVLEQTFRDFEIIVVNDGSTDKSDELVQQYHDPRIRVIDQPNAGVSAARNTGIRQAKYDYVAFLDADDIWDPQYLSEQTQLIRDFPEASLWGCAWKRISSNIHISSPSFEFPENYRGIVTNVWKQSTFPFWTSAVIVRKVSVMSLGNFDERITYGEDMDLWFRLLLRYPAAFNHHFLACYTHDAENKTTSVHQRDPKKYFFSFTQKYTSDLSSNPDFKTFYHTLCLNHLFYYFRKNPYAPEVQSILKQIDFKSVSTTYRFKYRHPYLYHAYATVQTYWTATRCKLKHMLKHGK